MTHTLTYDGAIYRILAAERILVPPFEKPNEGPRVEWHGDYSIAEGGVLRLDRLTRAGMVTELGAAGPIAENEGHLLIAEGDLDEAIESPVAAGAFGARRLLELDLRARLQPGAQPRPTFGWTQQPDGYVVCVASVVDRTKVLPDIRTRIGSRSAAKKKAVWDWQLGKELALAFPGSPFFRFDTSDAPPRERYSIPDIEDAFKTFDRLDLLGGKKS